MVNNFLKYLLVLFFISSAVYQPSCACSVFAINKEENLVIGRNYDWGFGEGYIMVNKRNQNKIAFTYLGESTVNLATWTSRYGSITFNQYGREIAFGGMNEAGLVVNELWLNESQYPYADARASMSVDQYVQYLLDNFSSVDEIAESDAKIRVRPTADDFTKIHFMATDATGKCIIIEFLNGKMVYHSGEDVPVTVMTNHTYDKSIYCWNAGVEPNRDNNRSLFNFYRAGTLVSNYDRSSKIIDYSFDILKQVGQGSWTKISVVFDIKNKKIYFKSLASPNIKYINFNEFDFSCQSVSRLLNVNIVATDNVTSSFIDYTTELNEDLIKRAWENLGSTNIYLPALKIISEYPETFSCIQTSVNQNTIEKEIRIFPNPVLNSFTVKSKIQLKGLLFEIFNMNGSLVHTEIIQNNITQFNSSLTYPGFYTIRLTSENINYKQTLIKY